MNARTVRALSSVALAAALLAAAGAAEAQGVAASRLARPYAMLVMDSSGSMEWEMGGVALPTCSATPGLSGKNRWITILEVLTGTFEDYRCVSEARGLDAMHAYQKGYYIPHIRPADITNPAKLPAQAEDGLLDIYLERINFGLMTLDSEPSAATDQTGAWSYPDALLPVQTRHVKAGAVQQVDWTNAALPGCTYHWNLGARRPDKNWPSSAESIDGEMIAVYTDPPGKASGWHKVLNKRIQEEMLEDVWPYWSSPVGAALEDSRYYFNNSTGHAHVKAKSAGGEDCYRKCRDRHVILITDGVPSGEGMPSCARDKAVGSAGACPYLTAEDAALALYMDKVKVHVIGFSLVTETIDYLADKTAGVRTGHEVVWDIGVAGWGGNPADCPWNFDHTKQMCALFADTPDELRDAVTDIFDQIVGDAASQTRTATVNTFVRPTNVMGQYQFFSSMNLSAGGPWEGNVERVAWLCKETAGVWDLERQAAVFDYGDEGLDKLHIASGDFAVRRLYTVPPDGNIPPNGGKMRPFVRLNDSLAPDYFGLDATDTAGRDELLDWLHGADGTDRCRGEAGGACRRLGAIFHSSPVVVGPPGLELPVASYNVGPHKSGYDGAASTTHVDYSALKQVGFRQLYGLRPQVLYVASTEGILHAFEVDRAGGDPRELWGFVPPMLLDNIHQQTLGESFLLDGHIAVQDTRLWKDESGAAHSVDEWATVLVMGLRQGGGDRGYFALDVTAPIAEGTAPSPQAPGAGGTMRRPADPGSLVTLGPTVEYGAPRLLWEIAPDRGTGASFAYADNSFGGHPDTFEGLGLAYGRPAFGTVLLDSNPPDHAGTRGEVAVVIIPAGIRPETTPAQPDSVGCGLYIVRASDGELIRWLFPTSASTGGHVNCSVAGGVPDCNYTAGWDCQFTGTPLALGSLPGDVTTRIFAGDADGRLYRADLRSANPAEWSLRLFFDFDNGEPIYEAPAAAPDARGLVTLVVGTGDPDYLEGRPTNRMASITETFGFDASGNLNPDTCATRWPVVSGGFLGDAANIRPGYCVNPLQGVFPWVNWVIQFDPGWSLPEARTGDFDVPMQVGERLLGWPVVFDEVAYFSTFVPSTDPDDCCSPGRGRIWGVHFTGDDPNATNDVYRPPTTAEPTPSTEIALLPENSIAFGVSLVRQPSCFEFAEDAVADWDGVDRDRLGPSTEPRYSLVVHTNATPTAAAAGETPETGFESFDLEAPQVTCQPDTWSSIFWL